MWWLVCTKFSAMRRAQYKSFISFWPSTLTEPKVNSSGFKLFIKILLIYFKIYVITILIFDIKEKICIPFITNSGEYYIFFILILIFVKKLSNKYLSKYEDRWIV